jgi:hypothetical protein
MNRKDQILAQLVSSKDNLFLVWDKVEQMRQYQANQYMFNSAPQPSIHTYTREGKATSVYSVDSLPEV